VLRFIGASEGTTEWGIKNAFILRMRNNECHVLLSNKFLFNCSKKKTAAYTVDELLNICQTRNVEVD
jgi:hypothetical protein